MSFSSNDKQKIKVAQKGFGEKHFLEISSYVEFTPEENYTRASDLIFLEISPNFDRKKKVVMRIDTMDLRALSYAIKECIKNGSSPYKKFTDPKLSGGNGNKKELSVAKDDKNGYINIKEGSNSIGFAMDFYSYISFADIIVLMAETTERMVYQYQRASTNPQGM